MSKEHEASTPAKKKAHGFFHRLFGEEHSGHDATPAVASRCNWKTFRASFSARTACRSCGISC